MRSHGDIRAAECCPAPSLRGWCDRLNLGVAVCRCASRYGQRVVFEQLDDHLLDDIAVDGDGWLRKSRDSEAAFRKMRLAGCGGFL